MDLFSFAFSNFIVVLMTLFAVIDSLGNIPLVIDLRKRHGHIKSLNSTLIAGFILLFILFTGEYVFALLGLKIAALGIAGALIIFILGAEMVLNRDFFGPTESSVSGATVFPLAFPIIAGPGSMSTVLSLKSMYSTLEIFLAIIVNMLIVFLVLKATDWITRKIGANGVMIIRKLFGVILLGLSSQMFITNIKILWFG